MALGFLAAWQVAAWLCRKTGRNPEPLTNLITLMMISGVAGSRTAYVIEHWSVEFAGHPERLLRLDQGGLMFYGGLILSILVFLGWCWRKKENVLGYSDLLTAVIPLGHAFGRVGCFFYGCCYGRVSECGCAVEFPRGSPAWYEQVNSGAIGASAQKALGVLPTQLMEAGLVACLFGVLTWVYLRYWRKAPGFTTGCYLAGYAVIRYFIEGLRGDPRAAVGAFTISQAISLGLLALGALFVAVAFKRKKL